MATEISCITLVMVPSGIGLAQVHRLNKPLGQGIYPHPAGSCPNHVMSTTLYERDWNITPYFYIFITVTVFWALNSNIDMIIYDA